MKNKRDIKKVPKKELKKIKGGGRSLNLEEMNKAFKTGNLRARFNIDVKK